jgi:DUF1707 SHOCT-like domain
MDAMDGGPGNLEGLRQGAAGDAAQLGVAGNGTAGKVPATETAGKVPATETAGKVPATETAGDETEARDGVRAADRSVALRASDRERDAVVQRIQQAFAEGRLDDTEFDERMRAALTARTHADLDVLLADLPAETAAPSRAPATVGRGPGRMAIALKSSVRRGGRWRVPERYTTVVYKGSGWLDLRAAELSGPVTSFLAVAYKSRVTILAPPGVRVEMTGFGVTQGVDEEDPGYRLPTDAPVIHVRGVAYKGTVEITTRPPERAALRG